MLSLKKLACASLLVFSQLALANPQQLVPSYSELLNSISQGSNIRAIMYVKKCSPSISEDAIAGMSFTNFNKYQVEVNNKKKDTIATSITMLASHPQFGAIYNYVRLRVFADDTVEIFSEYLDPTSFKPLASKTMNCKVSNGHDDNGVMLYRLT
jgi:hypothetical protein